MIIAVDFDGTIVEHRYPRIGKEIPFAIATLRRLQAEGHRIILWSAREGDLLREAIDFCRERGLEFYAANANCADEQPDEPGYSRKVVADIYIDDRNLGGLPGWDMIYQLVSGNGKRKDPQSGKTRRKSRSPWRRLFGI